MMNNLEGKVLVTGVNGFIGQAFSEICLKNKNIELIGVSRTRLEKNFSTYSVDICDQQALSTTIEKIRPHYIVHLAGEVFSNDLPALINTNIVGTYHLLKAAAKLDNACRVLLASSAAVYGISSEDDLPIKENHPCNPLSNYGLSKKWMSEMWQRNNFPNTKIIEGRIFNLLGPTVSEKLVVGAFHKKIRAYQRDKITEPMMVNSLSAIRDFLDVNDVAQALYLLLMNGSDKTIYNICSNTGIAIETLLKTMIQFSGMPIQYVLSDEALRHKEVSVSYGDNTKLISHTKWKQQYSFQDSIARMFL